MIAPMNTFVSKLSALDREARAAIDRIPRADYPIVRKTVILLVNFSLLWGFLLGCFCGYLWGHTP